MANDVRLTAKQFQEADGTGDWRVLAFAASAWFAAPSHTAGAALVRRIAELDLQPDMDLRARGLHVRIGRPDSAGFTTADVATARAVSAAATELGLTADPAAVQAMQLTVDALDHPSVMSFWRTTLGYEQLGEEDLVDAMRRDPALWFQEQDAPRPLRNRIHLDIVRPHELAVAAATAVKAGGAREMRAGAYYATLADAEGNEADIIPLVPDDRLGEEAETADWRVLFGAMTFYPIIAPVRAAELAGAVAGLADEADFPMLVDLRPEGVTIDTGKDQWEDARFPDLARQIQAAARAMALTADTRPLRFVQLGIDAVDVPAVREFWRAVLGYQHDPRTRLTDIFDPHRLAPPLFFQEMPAAEQDRRAQRNRIHIDLFVPDDQARGRIDAALAAGGRIVYDEQAPYWWTIADPEGNEVDIAVSVGRAEHWNPAAGSAE